MGRERSTGRRVERIPAERLPTLEMVPALAVRSPMRALLEVDVTEARRRLRDHRSSTGQRLSLTAYLIAAIARAVGDHPQVHAFRRGHHLVVFDEVDVATLVEVDADGHRVPLVHVVRDAAHRSVEEIQEELLAVRGAGAPLLRQRRRQIDRMRRVPRPLRWLIWRGLARSPSLRKRFGGTVTVTSVGMFGTGRGWGYARACHPVNVTVGTIVTASGDGDGSERLCLAVGLDHEVVDGAPAARFLADLRARIEGADDLAEPSSEASATRTSREARPDDRDRPPPRAPF